MAQNYQVTKTEAYTYTDEARSLVNGFRIHVFLPQYKETIFVFNPDLDPPDIKAKVEAHLKQRDALAKL